MAITKKDIDRYIDAYSRGESLITDEAYDILLEEYLDEHGESNRPFLRQQQSSSVNDVVGTLPKCYGVIKPMREGQKTYASWITPKGISNDDKIIIQPKFDGVSIALDTNKHRYFTRGDYDNGESVDVTELFSNHRVPYMHNLNDAVKYEAIMSHEIFKEFNLDKVYKRPRDAVAGIISRRDIEMAKCISLIPLREYAEGHQYISSTLNKISVVSTAREFDTIQQFIDDVLSLGAIVEVNDQHFSIDGVVVSVLDTNSDDATIPEKEVAIKILSNIKETHIKNIAYELGMTGLITPVGILEPVEFDNVTVTNVGLSNLNRVAELGLRYDDTVRIVYNIVPYLLDSYHDGNYPIPIISKCPICNHDLDMRTLKQVRCINPDCPGMKIGTITRYVTNMKMFGISEKTIGKLYEAGVVNTILDLYKITEEDIMRVEGFKEKSAKNIIKSIKQASVDVPVARWLGALPFKDINSKTWDIYLNSICNGNEIVKYNLIKTYFDENVTDLDQTDLGKLYIPGIGNATKRAMCEGWKRNFDEMKELIKYISFKITTVSSGTKGRVTLTGTRDKQLIEYLIEKGYDVGDFSMSTNYLIVPDKDFMSSKVAKAHKKGIPIYTIEEAYEKIK